MGSPSGELRCRTLTSSWFGHQSRLVLGVAPETGHLGSVAAVLSGTGFLSGISRGAGRAEAPVDDLGLVDRVAVVVGRSQAWRVSDGAIDIGDGTARPAHDVVMVV